MKKLTSFKKIGLKSTAMLLCLATSATAMTLAAPALFGAKAAEGDIPASVTLATGVNIDKTCDYGKTFTVPAGAKVTAPDGAEQKYETETQVSATQIGNYKVTFEKNGMGYDYYVRVRLDEEYFLKVDYDGADIPSYIQTEKTFTLPEARVVYYDEDNILREYPKAQYTVTASDSLGREYSFAEGGNRTFNSGSTTGTVFITYDAVVNGASASGTKHFNQTFSVNVQSTVNRSGNPTLSVSGVQRDVSVNRAVTLPKAEASDSYDDRVKVEIKVDGPDGYPVKTVDIDEDGYAYRDPNKDYDVVKFDNDRSMTFYPIETGTYKVSYTAYSDSFTDNGNTGKSSTREYFITVSDLVAPVFKKVDEYLIPETWGLVVEGENGEVAGKGGLVTFTIPEVVDNKDHMPTKDTPDTDNDLISVYFRITDADNSKTIVSFDNILSTDAKDAASTASTKPGQFNYNDVYTNEGGGTVTFNLDHPEFTFDFNKYAKTNKAGEKQDLAGEYTVLYRARDKANNTSSRTFTITLKDTYTDSAAPTDAKVTVPEYISAADETFTVPNAVFADASDTRLKKDYRIYTDKANASVKYIEVDGGEVADIVKDGGARYLVINKGKTNEKKLELGENLYFYVAATDKVGNFTSNCGDNNVASDTNFTECKAVVKVVPDNAAAFKYNDDNMTHNGSLKAGDNVTFGGFTITTEEKMRNYTGFEVAAYDANGNNVNVTLETTSKVVGGNALIIVQNIRFNVAASTVVKEGEDPKFYSLIVRVFDVNGVSNIYGYTVTDVAANENQKFPTSAITEIGTTGNANTTYKFKNTVIEDILGKEGDVFRVMRKVSGGAFAVMGSEFTAKSQGSYSVFDGYVEDNDIHEEAVNGAYKAQFDYDADKVVDTYNFSLTDVASPVIEVQGIMPTYKDFDKVAEGSANTKKATVEIPAIIAYTENGVAEVDIQVKDPKNKKVDYDKENRSFVATVDGAYTVTATATYKNAKETTATYTINVGDVQGPEFTLSDGTATSTTYTVGDTFEFATMTLKVSETGVTITKQLTNPAGEIVSEATVDGSYTNNNDRKNNGTEITFNMAGTYKVVYIARDTNNNETKLDYEITVVSSGTSTPTTWTTLSTVLIIVAVVLLAGVIVYVVRFRKVKK